MVVFTTLEDFSLVLRKVSYKPKQLDKKIFAVKLKNIKSENVSGMTRHDLSSDLSHTRVGLTGLNYI